MDDMEDAAVDAAAAETTMGVKERGDRYNSCTAPCSPT